MVNIGTQLVLDAGGGISVVPRYPSQRESLGGHKTLIIVCRFLVH